MSSISPPKTNENKSTWFIIVCSKVKFFRSFFGKIESSLYHLTFKYTAFFCVLFCTKLINEQEKVVECPVSSVNEGWQFTQLQKFIIYYHSEDFTLLMYSADLKEVMVNKRTNKELLKAQSWKGRCKLLWGADLKILDLIPKLDQLFFQSGVYNISGFNLHLQTWQHLSNIPLKLMVSWFISKGVLTQCA